MKNIKKTILITTMLILSAIVFTTTVQAQENWIVIITPENQNVINGSYVTVALTANNTGGGDAVGGWEITQFNWTVGYMNITHASQGTWLSSVQTTLYNKGTFSNATGHITDNYCAILGAQSTTNNGTMVTYNFTTYKAGIVQLTFYGLFSYGEDVIPFTATTGNITISNDVAPEITDNSPAAGTTGDFFLFNASVVDDVDIASALTVKVNWTHGTLSGNNSMTHVGGNYFTKQITLDHSISDLSYFIWVNDTYPNINMTSSDTATVSDNDDPTLVSDNSIAGTTGDSYNFSLDVSDNIQTEGQLTCYVNWSHGINGANNSMSYGGGHWYKVVTLDHNTSNVSYTFWINDTAGNFLSVTDEQNVTDNDKPTLVNDGSDTTATTGETFDFVLDVSDNIDTESGLPTVKANYTQGVYTANYTMSYSGGSWRVSFSVNDSTSNIVYFFYVVDTAGNKLKTSGDSPVAVTDNDPPVNLTNTTIDEKFTDATKIFNIDWTNISCNFTDNIGITGMYLNITKNGSYYQNISVLGNKTGATYFENSTYAAIGVYIAHFYGHDAVNNKKLSGNKQYTIYYKWDLNQDNDVNIVDLTSVTAVYGQTGANRWIKQDISVNGDINIVDLTTVTSHYGESY